ncbi:MAG: HAMP domain-containing sensor histidine kinase [Sneathiella sp.]
MRNYQHLSLISRLGLLAIAVFSISVPLFWLLFSVSVDRISKEVVDTRMIDFADQVRGHWASQKTRLPSTQAEDLISVTQSGLGGPDIEWIWQISRRGDVVLKSELLKLVGTHISSSIRKAGPNFTFSDRQTDLGKMRMVERIIEEPADEALENIHYLVGLSEARYNAYVTEHKERLNGLAFLGVLIMSASFFAILLLILFLARQQLVGVKKALALYQSGDTDSIEGQFPIEIQSIIDLLNGLLRQNQKLMERTRKYVSKITHDINHPLAVIKNGLKGEVDTSLLNRQVDKMTGLVDRYSSLARAVGPEGENRHRTNIANSLQDTADGFSILYRRTPVSIECQVAQDLTFLIPRYDLEAIVSNLVSNAHKFSKERILITAKIDNGALKITVEDDGPGIPDEQLENVMKWGARLDHAPPGSGFGLSIVHDMVDLYNGSIDLGRSNLGGLSASITLPPPL